MLSFTLVSHIGYMIFGIGLASVAGYAGAIFYTAHHITIQTTLFLVTGLIETRGGSTSLNRLGGLAAASPVLGVLFFVPAMNLAGIPPLSGFVGKVGLLEAGVAGGRLPGLPARRRLRGHQPADPLRHGEGLEPRLLAAPHRRAGRARAGGGRGGQRRRRRRPAPPSRRRPPRSARSAPGCRGRWSPPPTRPRAARRRASPSSPARCTATPSARPPTSSRALRLRPRRAARGDPVSAGPASPPVRWGRPAAPPGEPRRPSWC